MCAVCALKKYKSQSRPRKIRSQFFLTHTSLFSPAIYIVYIAIYIVPTLCIIACSSYSHSHTEFEYAFVYPYILAPHTDTFKWVAVLKIEHWTDTDAYTLTCTHTAGWSVRRYGTVRTRKMCISVYLCMTHCYFIHSTQHSGNSTFCRRQEIKRKKKKKNNKQSTLRCMLTTRTTTTNSIIRFDYLCTWLIPLNIHI